MEETTGDRIRRLREERRWSQETLGDLINVTSRTISNWETGKHVPRSSMGALEKVFGEALDGDQPADPVELAIKASGLADFRQTRVLSAYQEQVYEQQREDRTG